jgi:hypothetical protein
MQCRRGLDIFCVEGEKITIVVRVLFSDWVKLLLGGYSV